MRMHLDLDDRLAAQVDEIAGPRGRSAFVRRAVERAVEESRRWAAIDDSAALFSEDSHDWDSDPAAWVRAQRRGDDRRAG